MANPAVLLLRTRGEEYTLSALQGRKGDGGGGGQRAWALDTHGQEFGSTMYVIPMFFLHITHRLNVFDLLSVSAASGKHYSRGPKVYS